MTVLHIGKYYPPHWGGMETAVKDMCEVLNEDVDLRVLVASDDNRDHYEVRSGVRVERMATWRTVFSQPVCRGLWRRLRSTRADIVHLHEPNPLALLCFLVSGNPAQLVVHYHSDIVRQRRLVQLYLPWLRRGLSRASAIIVGSHELRDSSATLTSFRNKCVVVPFGVDLRPFLGVDASRRNSPLPRILAVGRLSYYKGYQYLIEAMPDVPAHLTIVGGGELLGTLRAQALRLGLGARVTFAGRATDEQLIEHYRRADIFCLPSCERSEAFGLVQVEAMGAALPVVSTDLPTGVRSINLAGETGLVVPPKDPQSLASALRQLAGDPLLRAEMGRRGRDRAVSHFCRSRMGSQIADVYRSVLGRGGSHRGASVACSMARVKSVAEVHS